MKNFKNKKHKHIKKDNHAAPKAKNRANIWGTHAVLEALQNTDRKVYNLFITKEALSTNELPSSAPSPEIIEKKELERIVPKGAVHQGIAINCSALKENFLKDLIIKSEANEKSLLLILDQITDPHNVGAIIRSACAFGASGIIMQKKHAPESHLN
jgi:23S rRNA (guanosine2251-2'-O)-methyltransferase